MTISASKMLFRKQLKDLLRNLTQESKDQQSSIITEKILACPQYQASRRIGVFLSTPDEVNTDALVKDVLSSGKECFVPRCTADTMFMEKLKSLDDFENLPLNKWGIREPLAKDSWESSDSAGGLDLVLVPGLGFTVCGKRLGKGKGYYDKFLFSMKEIQSLHGKPFFTIGLAFKEQIVRDLPVGDHDYNVNSVVSS